MTIEARMRDLAQRQIRATIARLRAVRSVDGGTLAPKEQDDGYPLGQGTAAGGLFRILPLGSIVPGGDGYTISWPGDALGDFQLGGPNQPARPIVGLDRSELRSTADGIVDELEIEARDMGVIE